MRRRALSGFVSRWIVRVALREARSLSGVTRGDSLGARQLDGVGSGGVSLAPEQVRDAAQVAQRA